MMKRARDTSLTTFFNEKKKIQPLDETTEIIDLPREVTQEIFKNLTTKDLVSVSRVCTKWNTVAKDKILWQNVCLDDVKICNWKKLVAIIQKQNTLSLDAKFMELPPKIHDIEIFWAQFIQAMKVCTNLKVLKLYGCPANILNRVMSVSSHLTILKASFVCIPERSKPKTYPIIPLYMDPISTMTNLLELRLDSITDMELRSSQTLTFENLTKLKTLSLTCITTFPQNICTSLTSLATNLEVLVIGNCRSLPDDFPILVTKLTNLKLLQLRKCQGRWEEFALKTFEAISSLQNLKILELIHIEVNHTVGECLEKCNNIRGLLIIPVFESSVARCNRILIDGLEKIADTITHLVYGIPIMSRISTEQLINLPKIRIPDDINIHVSQTTEHNNNTQILRSRYTHTQDIDIISIPSFQTLLETMMLNAKVKVISYYFMRRMNINLAKHFDDL